MVLHEDRVAPATEACKGRYIAWQTAHTDEGKCLAKTQYAQQGDEGHRQR
jgi:hypothetical protein